MEVGMHWSTKIKKKTESTTGGRGISIAHKQVLQHKTVPKEQKKLTNDFDIQKTGE